MIKFSFHCPIRRKECKAKEVKQLVLLLFDKLTQDFRQHNVSRYRIQPSYINVVDIIKDAIHTNTYNDQVTEFNKDVQKWENRFLSLKNLLHQSDLSESEKMTC